MATKVDNTASMLCRRHGCSSENLAERVVELEAENRRLLEGVDCGIRLARFTESREARLLAAEKRVERLELALTRVLRDRRERDKVLAEVLTVMPELGETVNARSARAALANPRRHPLRGINRWVTVEELRKAEARFKRASHRAEEAREARNEAIRKALGEGWTHQRISEATGLTRGRINQIANP